MYLQVTPVLSDDSVDLLSALRQLNHELDERQLKNMLLARPHVIASGKSLREVHFHNVKISHVPCAVIEYEGGQIAVPLPSDPERTRQKLLEFDRVASRSHDAASLRVGLEEVAQLAPSRPHTQSTPAQSRLLMAVAAVVVAIAIWFTRELLRSDWVHKWTPIAWAFYCVIALGIVVVLFGFMNTAAVVNATTRGVRIVVQGAGALFIVILGIALWRESHQRVLVTIYLKDVIDGQTIAASGSIILEGATPTSLPVSNGCAYGRVPDEDIGTTVPLRLQVPGYALDSIKQIRLTAEPAIVTVRRVEQPASTSQNSNNSNTNGLVTTCLATEHYHLASISP